MKRNFIIIITLFFITSCASSPTGRNQLMLVSPEQAISSSKTAYVETLKPLDVEGKVDNHPELTKRIKLITGRLITQAIKQYPFAKNWGWQVKVIDDPKTINAWCMAGGKMAIYTGLINELNATNDEIAQVMGHEISHALAHHTAEQMSIAMATQVGIMGIGLAVKDSKYSSMALSGTALAASLAIKLPNSRTAESEADRMGIEIAAKSGYNPNAAVTLWQKMDKANKDKPPEFLSTHPNPENRQATLKSLIPKMMKYYQQKKEYPVYPL
ncbi:MAG: M48 family metallopeptidase [Gammaproteobacteria bacterium]|nr:M48 family metallopeptidase [Gammaproteobacteria bacterium]